jgi:hypothetical protein
VDTAFDLHAWCACCGGALSGSSTERRLSRHTDGFFARADDELEVGGSIDLIVEVRSVSSKRCGNWNRDVLGNVATVRRPALERRRSRFGRATAAVLCILEPSLTSP